MPFIAYTHELIWIEGEKHSRGRRFVMSVWEQRWGEAEDSTVFFLSFELRPDLVV